ncbi:unnamed protein product [Peniophora sp. CBMAI 1063]|nr:unnamed protein product [Peniophora sp. CBMAI 1063]
MASIQNLPQDCLLDIFLFLAVAWPAGKYRPGSETVDLGWVLAGHVCHRWRSVLLGSRTIWSLWATSFCNTDALRVFVERAGPAGLWLDMNIMHRNSIDRGIAREVLDAVMDPDLWRRARGIITNAGNRGHLAFTPLLPQRLTSFALLNVHTVDIFLPRQFRLDREIVAPALTSITIRSDAAVTSQCPVPVRILMALFETSTILRFISLRRCVDTTPIHVFPPGGRDRRLLSVLDVGCMDERLLHVIHHFFIVDSSSSVSIDLYSVSQLSGAMNLCFEDFGLNRSLVKCMGIHFDDEHARGEGRDDLFRSYFFAIRLHIRDDFVVILRMDEGQQTWSWRSFIDIFPCSNITSLTLRNPADLESQTVERPGELLNQLQCIDTVTVSDRQHVDLLNAIPLTSPISTIVVDMDTAADNEDLADIWHWLQRRGKKDRTVRLLLTGRLLTADDIERYRRIEAPVISALEVFVTVEDHRVLEKTHSSRVYHA